MKTPIQIIILALSLLQPATAAIKFLAISDIHYGSENKLGEDKDAGNELLKISLEKFKELSQQVDFILNLGDLPTHGLWLRHTKELYEQAVFHGLYEADKDQKPMFYITGNNDSLTGNYQAFESHGKSPLDWAVDWQGACAHCEGLIIDKRHMYSGGYYSTYVIPDNKDIILIALNSIQWTKSPLLALKYPHQDEDALAQLSWFEEQLKRHHAKQLLIAMHVPPGNDYKGVPFWYETYLQKFIALLEAHYNSYDHITLLTAHTHMDELRKIDLSGHPALYAYSIPSISRIHRNNSGIKIFTLNQHMAIENYTTYYTSSLDTWNGEQYQALGSSHAVFPQCKQAVLSECLDTLSDQEVCTDLEQGLFYGVKSPRVYKGVCKVTYKVRTQAS